MSGSLAYDNNDGTEELAMLMCLMDSLKEAQRGIIYPYSSVGQGMVV